MSDAALSRRNFLRGRLRKPLSGHTQPSGEPAPAPPPSREDRRRAALAHMTQVRRVAQVQRHACLGAHSQVCTVCVERCPEESVITLRGTLPVVDAQRCTGCGECERHCPAPFPAIRVLPEPTT